ncbi:MAG: hypothetical protein HY718_19710 [Planctomycetes bacterium]|nr:hypothetical protein [Planctomycetota bacterium]
MSLGPFSSRRYRWALLILVSCCWMSMGVLSDCDPAIANQVLDGVGNATADVAGTLIQALFDSIKPEAQTPVTTSSTLDVLRGVGWLS